MNAPFPRLLLCAAVALALAAPIHAQAPKDKDKGGADFTLPWDADWVTAVTYAGDNRVVAGNNLGEIMMWELPEKVGGGEPKPVRKFEGHTNVITRLLTSPDGRWLISSSNDHTIRFWDLQAPATKKSKFVVNARAIDESAEKKRKAPAPIEFSVESVGENKTFSGHRDWVVAMSQSKDGLTLASGDEKGEIILWDVAAGSEKKRWKLKGWVWALALSPDADAVAASERIPLVFDSGRYQAMKIWNPLGEVKLDLSKTLEKMVVGAAQFSPDGKRLAIGKGGESDFGKVILIDLSTGKIHKEFTPGHMSGMTDVAYSPDGKTIASAGRDTLVRVWDAESGKLLKELGVTRGGQFRDWICAVAFSPNGEWVAGADMAGQIQIWNINKK